MGQELIRLMHPITIKLLKDAVASELGSPPDCIYELEHGSQRADQVCVKRRWLVMCKSWTVRSKLKSSYWLMSHNSCLYWHSLVPATVSKQTAKKRHESTCHCFATAFLPTFISTNMQQLWFPVSAELPHENEQIIQVLPYLQNKQIYCRCFGWLKKKKTQNKHSQNLHQASSNDSARARVTLT